MLGQPPAIGVVRVVAGYERAGDRDDLVDGQPGVCGVAADRLRADRFVYAEGAGLASIFIEDVAAEPSQVVGDPLVGYVGSAFQRRCEVRV